MKSEILLVSRLLQEYLGRTFIIIQLSIECPHYNAVEQHALLSAILSLGLTNVHILLLLLVIAKYSRLMKESCL
jgi:hypothetical protein